ncbi:MAG: hypothetical protein J6I80_01895 [Clostridia bacterium]|nr:hypothetical protein [Clostridia bacterium]
MAEYTREDFVKMNEQAARHAGPNMQLNGKRPQRQPPQKQTPPPPPPERQQKRGKDLLEMFNFKNLELDGDRIIIIALALLLSAEEADELLIMALIYIML